MKTLKNRLNELYAERREKINQKAKVLIEEELKRQISLELLNASAFWF